MSTIGTGVLNIETLRAEVTPILDVVGRNIRTAIALTEVHKPASFDRETIAKFDNTFAAHVIMVLRDAVTLSVVAALGRIWDEAKDTQSIPRLAQVLRRPGVIDLLADNRHKHFMSIGVHGPIVEDAKSDPDIARWLREAAVRDADEAQSLLREKANQVLEEIGGFQESRRAASLRAARDRLIAHSLELTRTEKKAHAKGEAIEPLKRGEIDDIMRSTIAVARSLELVFRGSDPDLTVFQEVWFDYSSDFWQRIT